MAGSEDRINHAPYRHRCFIPLGDIGNRLEEIDSMLHNVWYMMRLCADIAGEHPSGHLTVNAEAISTAMRFFADELAGARASVTAIGSIAKHWHRPTKN